MGPGANQVTVNLTGVSTAQHLNVTLNAVSIANGGAFNNLSVPLDVLVGDVSLSKVVDSADVGLIQRQNNIAVTSSNFTKDLNSTGAINSADVGIVQRQNQATLPPQQIEKARAAKQ